MYNKQQHGRLYHVTGVAPVLCLWMVVNLLVASCDACGGRSPPRRPPPTKTPAARTTSRPTSGPSVRSSGSSSGTTVSPTESPSDNSPSENCVCFSTTCINITRTTIAAKLKQLSDSGSLSNLFIGNTTEQSVFLECLKPNDTGCSNVQGYMIKIRKTTSDPTSSYKHNITRLDKESAEKRCNQSGNCSPLSFSAIFMPTTASPKITEAATSKQTRSTPADDASSKKPNTGAGEGTVAARSKADAAVSTTKIVIPVTVVVVLIICVVIFALWFKRRKSACSKELTETQNSVDRLAGPINGDVYTVVNPSAEKKNNGKNDSNDLVYTELAEIKRGKRDNKQPESDRTEYADITHILTSDTTTFENSTPQTDENETYTNVVALNK